MRAREKKEAEDEYDEQKIRQMTVQYNKANRPHLASPEMLRKQKPFANQTNENEMVKPSHIKFGDVQIISCAIQSQWPRQFVRQLDRDKDGDRERKRERQKAMATGK